MQTCLVFLPVGLFSPLFTFTGFLNCMLFVIVQLPKCLRHLKLIASEQFREWSSIFLVLKCSAHTGNVPALHYVLLYDAAFPGLVLSVLLFHCLTLWRGWREVSLGETEGQNFGQQHAAAYNWLLLCSCEIKEMQYSSSEVSKGRLLSALQRPGTLLCVCFFCHSLTVPRCA